MLRSSINELKQYCIGEPKHFDESFSNTRLPALSEVVELLQNWKNICAFVEIKRSSLRHFGCATVLHAVLQVIQPILEQCVIISFDSKVLIEARKEGIKKIGWVLEELSE